MVSRYIYFFLFLESLFFELHQNLDAFSISKAGREHKRDEQTISTTLSSLPNTRDKDELPCFNIAAYNPK